jgi:NCS1 family nucleobase:cation symporter-1
MSTSTAAAQAQPAGDRAFSVEEHGIDVIPAGDRHGHPRELFWVWLGANIIFTYVITGAIIISFGLNFWAGLAAVVIGNLFYILVGIGAIAGPVAGTATLTISRSAFGVLGNIPAAILSWVTVVGWEAVNIVIGTLSLFALVQLAGFPDTTVVKALCLAVVMLVTFTVAVWGHATIVTLNRILAILLAVGTVVLAAFVIPKINLNAEVAPLAADTPFAAWLLALLVIAAGPFSWVNYPADYSRYLPASTSKTLIAMWTTLGGLVPAILIGLVGVAAATATDMTDPVAGLSNLVPAWFFAPYLAVIVGGTITNNFLNTYSSGLSLLAVGIRIKRYKAVLIDAVLGGLLSVYAVFVFNFTDSFIQFLSLMVIWIAPWAGIFFADMLLRKNRYDGAALHAHEGRYWYSNGWNFIALGSFVAGIVVAALFANAPIWQGPLTKLIGGGDVSIYVGFLVSGGLYLALMRRPLQPEASAETPTAQAAMT